MRLNRKLISLYLVLLSIFSLQVLCEDEISIMGIEPNGGLTSGETRVLVHLRNFKQTFNYHISHPSCRFGSLNIPQQVHILNVLLDQENQVNVNHLL